MRPRAGERQVYLARHVAAHRPEENWICIDDVVTVRRALGHVSATTTLNTYSHLSPTAEDSTRRAAEQLFSDSCRPIDFLQERQLTTR